MIIASALMDAAIDTDVQRPRFKLLSYDISQATGDTWGAIIRGNAVQTPVDLTADVSQIQWSYDRLSVTIADNLLSYHPDSGADRCAISPGRGLRLFEGAEGVPEGDWLPIFSGPIQGPYAWSLTRGPVPVVTVNAFTRDTDQSWNRRMVTSKEYSIGSDWSNMFFNIAQDLMGLEDIEIAIPKAWNLAFDKTSNQIVNIPPWEGLVALSQGNFERLWFNGNGQLASYPFTLDRIDLSLKDSKKINQYSQPGNNSEVINKVVVTYIDNVLTKVSGARTNLGTANITTGFFDFQTKLDVFYSEDKKQRADNVELVVKQSINQNDLGISIGTETLDIKDEFGGELVITVDAFVSALAVAGIGGILASSFIGDTVVAFGGGLTIPTGRIIEGVAIVAVLLAMMILGTGVYEIVGTPYEYAFLEKQAIALLDNTPFWEEKQKDIRNDFISTECHAHQLALNELLFEQSIGHPRSMVIQNDPRIEKGDIIELPNGAKFFVTQASKSMSRGGVFQLNLQGFKSVV
jgi:hypothetical protein